MKMQSQLILLTVGAVAPLSALVVAVAFWSIGQQRDMTADTMRDTSFILALALERELSGTVSTLEGLGLSRTLPNQDYEGFRHKASGLTGRRKLWSAIAVADPDGIPVVNTAAPASTPLPSYRDPSLQDALHHAKAPAVTNLFSAPRPFSPGSPAAPESLVAVLYPVHHDGVRLCTLLALIPAAKLSVFLQEQPLPEGGIATIIDSQGTVIARSRNAAAAVGRTLPDAAIVRQIGPGTLVPSASIDGDPVYIAATPVRHTRWTVLFVLPAEAVNRPLLLSRSAVAAGLLAALAMALAWAGRLGHRITRDMQALTGAIRGNGPAPLPPAGPAAIDEIADLRIALQDASGVNHQKDGAREQGAGWLRRAWDEAEAARRDAERANHAKAIFLASASHALRQPVQSLFLLTDRLREKLKDHPAAPIVGMLQQTARALNQVTDGILDVSTIGTGAVKTGMADVPLAELLLRIGQEYGPRAADKGLTLRSAGCSILVRTDPLLLERIVRNLVENSLRFTRSGGILVGCRRRGPYVRLDVVDTGCGIAAEHLDRIFDGFFQAGSPGHDRTKGLGLGLTVVRHLADALGHPVEVRSVPGRGTRVSVRLPVAAARRPESPDPDGGPPERRASRGNLLLVEDEPYVRATISAVLTEWGFTILEAVSARDAVALLGDRRPDLIVADCRLRGNETGDEAIAIVRSHCGQNIPAILVTGDTSPERLVAAHATGAALLHKPVSLHELRKTIHRELQRA